MKPAWNDWGVSELVAPALRMAALVLLVLLAGCTGPLRGVFDSGQPAPPQPAPVPQAPVLTGVKVALILPLSGAGETARIGQAMKQAAEMALFDAGNAGITLVTKDTGGTGPGAERAAREAIAEGAELILGPLLANEVQAVSPVARASNVPVIAFSSVSATGGRGTYLLSFLPEQEVDAIIRHAGQNGIRSVVVMLPKTPYGSEVERAVVDAGKRNGVEVTAIERYSRTPEAVNEPAKRTAEAVNAGVVQGVMIAEGSDMLRQIGFALQRQGLSPAKARMLGTGLWDDASARTTPVVVGGWYAGVAPDLIARFDQRYSKSYGRSAPRLASLSYDAVSLAIILGRGGQGQRFSTAAITNPEGFQGINGLFRFRPNGLSERGLSILELTSGGPRVIAPAPQRFMAGY
ncbi:MAG: penicillin-binding protein activator [Parvibaculaceae bacterium]